MINTTASALILVVDDDALQRIGASDMFLDAGYRVLEAENADEALRCLETNPDIELLFTDVAMPGTMSGSDLASQVEKRWPKIGIIVTSGLPRPNNLPVDTRFHAKPYEPDAILLHASGMTRSRLH